MIIKKFKTKIDCKKTIIDIEITNDLSALNWDYTKCDICTLGIIKGNNIKIIQREKTDDLNKFKKDIKKILDSIKEFYAFNWRMEKGGISGFLDKEYKVNEIKAWSGKGWSKDKFFNELKSIIKIKDEVEDPLNGHSELVPERYAENNYKDIILHNRNCLIKEAYLLKYREDLIKENKCHINSDGWWKDNKFPATEKQIQYLIDLGCRNPPKTKDEASKKIKELLGG